MSLDPQRASVVLDLLETATRAGALEKQEAAAILSSWIEDQKQQQQQQEQQPAEPFLPDVSGVGDSGSLSRRSRRSARQGSTPGTPNADPRSLSPAASPAAVGDCQQPGRFVFLPSQEPPLLTPPPLPPRQLQQQQQRRRQPRARRQKSVEPIRSFLNVFASCALGGGSSNDAGAREMREQEQHLHQLHQQPQNQQQQQKQLLYALYDPSGGGDQTYCYIDDQQPVPGGKGANALPFGVIGFNNSSSSSSGAGSLSAGSPSSTCQDDQTTLLQQQDAGSTLSGTVTGDSGVYCSAPEPLIK